MSKKKHFPIYADISDRRVTVFGGGNIALRRIKSLLEFDFEITAVSPEFCAEIEELASQGELKIIHGKYEEKYLGGNFMVLACTNDRQVNREIGEMSRDKGIMYINVCDNREECNFFFPSVIFCGGVTVSVAGDGTDHKKTKAVADSIRRLNI